MNIHTQARSCSVLYLIYIDDITRTLHSKTENFADDTVVMATVDPAKTSTKRLQSALDKVAIWTEKWCS